MIIGLGHQQQVGKDMVAAYLVEEHGFHRIGFADALKQACQKLFDWPHWDLTQAQKEAPDYWWDEQLHASLLPLTFNAYVTPRRLLQEIGCMFRDNLNKNFWIKVVEHKLDKRYGNCNVVIPDVRFPNEAEMIKKRGGIVVKVDRPGYGGNDNHVSETAMLGYDWDVVLKNDGTPRELCEKVRQLLPVYGLDATRRR